MREHNHEGEQLVESWVHHGIQELRAARHLTEMDDYPPHVVGYLAQQSVEKLIKALLLENSVDFPFTHDLEELATLIPKEHELAEEQLRQAGSLTEFATKRRYPSPLTEVRPDTAETAIQLAEQLHEPLLSRLNDLGLSTGLD